MFISHSIFNTILFLNKWLLFKIASRYVVIRISFFLQNEINISIISSYLLLLSTTFTRININSWNFESWKCKINIFYKKYYKQNIFIIIVVFTRTILNVSFRENEQTKVSKYALFASFKSCEISSILFFMNVNAIDKIANTQVIFITRIMSQINLFFFA